MTVTWLGHACFAIEHEGYRIVSDPWREVPGFGEIKTEADAVFCSHDHYDHAATETVTITSGDPSPFTVTEIPSFHDEVEGKKRGGNTIRIFAAGGLRVAHLGDLGHLLNDAALAALRGVDVLLIPIGGVYTIDPVDAKQLADAIGAAVTVPMHYRRGTLGFENIADVEEFLSQFDSSRIIRINGSNFCPTEFLTGTILLPSYRSK